MEPPACFGVNRVVEFFDSFALLFFSSSYLLTARDGSVVLLSPCQVLVVQSFAFSFRMSKVGPLIEWKLSSSFRTCCKNPIIRNLNSCSSRSLVILSYNMMWCSLHPMSESDFLYSSTAYHLESIVGWPQHLLRMEVHILSFRSTVLSSTASVFLDHVSRD